MSDKAVFMKLIDRLKERHIEFAPGLTDNQVTSIEQSCGFKFPSDLKTFLQLGVPVKQIRYPEGQIYDVFPNWHDDPQAIMQETRERVIDMFHFDIELNNFWMEEWGPRPQDLSAAFALVDDYLETVPTLIRIYGHRYLPAEPLLSGNPVFSVAHPVDTVYYGYNLEHYLKCEFLGEEDWGDPSDYREIPFWSSICS